MKRTLLLAVGLLLLAVSTAGAACSAPQTFNTSGSSIQATPPSGCKTVITHVVFYWRTGSNGVAETGPGYISGSATCGSSILWATALGVTGTFSRDVYTMSDGTSVTVAQDTSYCMGSTHSATTTGWVSATISYQ